jgi:ferredoxin
LTETREEVRLFLDIGTNGEIVVGNGEWLMACACSAGPAFEGSGIGCGMRASKGAIERVRIESATGVPQLSVVGGGKPRGICGSGLIDLVAELTAAKVLDPSGRLNPESPRVRPSASSSRNREYLIASADESSADKDLALTELRGGFVVAVGSERGHALVEQLPVRATTAAELELAELKLQRAREQMGRQLETAGVKELLDKNLEHPEWDDVALRCLSCGNCTMVCPTCFCCTVADSTYLGDPRVTRTRYWESCYTHQFTHTTTGPERNTIRGRYRHWLRHKLGTWLDQFGTTGCIGCGRCITWCPVGIDITEETKAIRASDSAVEV